MTIMTLIATVIIPGDEAKPVTTLVWPGGRFERVTLQDHDWGNDFWDWRGGHMPQSLDRHLRRVGLERIHGSRAPYISPADVGVDSNECGRLMVYEIEYEA
jgi:hypothetical protein